MKGNDIPQAGERAIAPTRGEANPCSHILLVDDDIFIRQLNAEVLVHSGYHVDNAEDGAAGWEALQVKSYDLLITDYNMPKLTGVQLVRKLRAARMAVPVIMAAGRLPTEELARDPSLQVAATLLKPFTIAEFLGTVSKVLHAPESACARAEVYAPELAGAESPMEWSRNVKLQEANRILKV